MNGEAHGGRIMNWRDYAEQIGQVVRWDKQDWIITAAYRTGLHRLTRTTLRGIRHIIV